ncbi:MFS transporter [Corynebacterium sp. MC-07]|nr:MFS transporter [Corynebacterium pseudokroppenstedtii]MCF8702088.1 MFS transporter [Corynebacterium pseudokroppenstedtii]MCG2635767.1 MFS transporter [Corynebacterium pseudokroppenstedtii]
MYGCASSFFTPARFGLLALLFTDSQRTRVNGTVSILGDVLYIAGPLIGTAAVITLGFRTVLLIDGATFLIAMLFVLPFFKVRRNSATDDAPGTHEAEEATPASDADPANHANDADSANTDAASAQTKVNSAKKPTAVLPRWVQVGLGTWLVASLVNGFLGSAGPTWIMNSFDEKTWGFMATALAIGSLLGSAATILRKLDRVRFTTLQFLMLLFLAGQLLALTFSPVFIVIALVGAVASLLMTSAGVSWDSLGQSLGKDELVHQFATKDQLVFTAGTPLGMVLFATFSGHPHMSALILSVLLVAAAIVSCLPIARSPRVADVTDDPSALGT